MNKKQIGIVMAVALLVGGRAFAEVRLHELFSDNAVLQQSMSVPVWGTASDGEKVTVTFAGQTAATTAKDGRWIVKLNPLKANATPQTMTVAGANTIEVKNLLVGEVWICSGAIKHAVSADEIGGVAKRGAQQRASRSNRRGS